jgi:beta-lactam-binding protein with PASTA domain
MLQFFRYLLLALVLVTVFLASALTSMRFAIHGRETVVPKLTGMTLMEAQRVAAANGLPLQVENRFYSASVAEGRILSQAPAHGATVRRGWMLRVAESLGPQRVTIPSVLGQSEHAAEINLVQRGLQLGTVAVLHLPGMPADQVIAQSPLPKAEGVASPKVNLLLTAPEGEKTSAYVMPDFVGLHFGSATSAIATAGFKLGGATVRPLPDSPFATDPSAKLRAIATDTVVNQFPAAGQRISTGAVISFEVVR